jgi:hypothetical protein
MWPCLYGKLRQIRETRLYTLLFINARPGSSVVIVGKHGLDAMLPLGSAVFAKFSEKLVIVYNSGPFA